MSAMSAMSPSSAEKGPSALKSVESSKLIVTQPAKLKELGKLLETLDTVASIGNVSERSAEDSSSDMGGAGGGSSGQSGTRGASARDLAIQAMPSEAIMQQRLTKHIRQETRKLEKMAKAVARSSQPGSAHKLNEIYAKIRRMNALVHQLVHASVEVIKRFFVRVFIDNQPIL
jgi:hypothetical protein